MTVNGHVHERVVDDRQLLVDFLRDELYLTGTKVGCAHGVCGSCTVHLDGVPVRSCLRFAVQADGREITTVEGLASERGDLSPLQQAFWEQHGLQCGFCTPGFLMAAMGFIARGNLRPDDADVREAISGNICRCTGYESIVEAVKAAVRAGEAEVAS
jgi:carbon-monoxide dehydrogenase small subunit